MNAKLILTNVIGHMEFVLIRSEVTNAIIIFEQSNLVLRELTPAVNTPPVPTVLLEGRTIAIAFLVSLETGIDVQVSVKFFKVYIKFRINFDFKTFFNLDYIQVRSYALNNLYNAARTLIKKST